MAIEKDNDCVGCPQGCIHCGRGDYYYIECDDCGSSDGKFFEIDGNYYCPNCYKEMLPRVITYYPDGYEEEKFYYDGFWYGEDDQDNLDEILNANAISEMEILEAYYDYRR